tara:strand:+ start:1 stop:801 length:801 start_codon:yes stop_codon:yes gene_type:complete
MYSKKISKSFQNLQFLLFVPDLFLLLFSIILGAIFFNYLGLDSLLANQSIFTSSLESLLPHVNSLIQNNLLRFAISLIVFFITSFIVGSGLNAMKYGMMRDVIQSKKLDFKTMFNYGGDHFWRVVGLRVLIFFIGLAVFLTFAILLGINSLNPFYKEVFSFILIAILVFVLILLRILLLFRYPILFLDNKTPTKTIKNLYVYFKKRFQHIIITWLIIFIIGLFLIPINYGVNLIGIAVVVLPLTYAINLIYTVWRDLFLFFSYKLK